MLVVRLTEPLGLSAARLAFEKTLDFEQAHRLVDDTFLVGGR